MQKDFQKWHDKKSQIDDLSQRPFFQEREVWWCRVGLNIGFEQDGKGEKFARPVVVVSKFNNEVFWALPLTTAEKVNKFYSQVDIGDGKIRTAIVSQIRLMDAKRLMDKLGQVRKEDFLKLKQAIARLLKISLV